MVGQGAFLRNHGIILKMLLRVQLFSPSHFNRIPEGFQMGKKSETPDLRSKGVGFLSEVFRQHWWYHALIIA